MGKKSKKNSAAKAKADGAAGQSTAPQDAIAAAAGDNGGGILTSTGGSKKLKCTRCYGNIKIEKAHECPGCSDLFCWRCEKKQFEECPDGANCVHPIRRCKNCFNGGTMISALCPSTWSRNISIGWDGRTRFENGDYLALEEAIVDGILNADATPFRYCQDACGRFQCYRCATSSEKKDTCIGDIFSCVVCAKARCGKCIVEKSEMLLQLERGGEAELLEKFSDTISACRACKKNFCFECLGPLIRTIFDNGATSFLQTRDPLCKGCYWSTKPCTNPNCPNELGIPTKRCGGCHIDRYCSVECQAAAYPSHMARCQKIQDKRLLAMEEYEVFASILSREGTGTNNDSCSSEEEEALQDDGSDDDTVVHKDLFEEFARDYGYGCVSM